jgi:fumarylacetoacetase
VTWIDLPSATGFGLDNLPHGIFSTADGPRRTGIAIGEHVLDLGGLTQDPVHRTGTLNAFLALGPQAWRQLREQVTDWLTDDTHRSRVKPHLLPLDDVALHLPVEIADYVDFYSSRHHAENLGRMFRPGSAPLAHMTANGAGLRTGDLFASGTVSGPGRDQRGSLIELCWGGKEPLTLPDGSTRTFLEDGDVVTITATAPGTAGGCISLAEVTGTVGPAR